MNRKGMNSLAVIMLVVILGSLFSMAFDNRLSGDENLPATSVEEKAKRVYSGYADVVTRQIESRIDSIFSELAILRGIEQNYIDNSVALESVTDAFKTNPVTADKLTYNGKWYQNGPSEPNVVMVHRHLLDESGQIKPDVQRDIDNTIMLDLVLSSFHKNGVEKQLTYTQGGLNKSFTRMYPWVDLGTLFYEVYPAFVDTSIWDAFNPGLVEAFEKRMQEEKDVQEDPNKLARVLLPVQDGVTGEIIMTFTAPLFDPDRQAFRGTVAFDVTMTEIIDLIEDLNVSQKGFTFLSQSNGNIFAINEEGAEVLGFSEDRDSLEITGQGVGFNRLERMLAESRHESVQGLKLPESEDAQYQSITIEGENYMVIMQRLKPFQIWEPGDWFKAESWVVGIVVPESEMLYDESLDLERETGSKNLLYSILIACASLMLFGLAVKQGAKSEADKAA